MSRPESIRQMRKMDEASIVSELRELNATAAVQLEKARRQGEVLRRLNDVLRDLHSFVHTLPQQAWGLPPAALRAD